MELVLKVDDMCKDPKEIKFAPLNRDEENTAEELMTIFEVGKRHGCADIQQDRHLGRYLHIIKDAPGCFSSCPRQSWSLRVSRGNL
jgi:hypothetical protein